MKNSLKMLPVIGLLIVAKVFATQPVVDFDVEIPVERVFVSPEGYDDNDNVTVVLHGNLPSMCFEETQATVKIEVSTKKIYLTQLAHRKSIPECRDGKTPKGFGLGGLFTTEVQVGTLSAGEYTIVYNRGTKGSSERTFVVAKAPNPESVDEALYAPFYSAFIPDLVYETNNAEVVLSGVLGSTCLDLDPANIQVIKFSDVIVLLPKLTVLPNQECEAQELPLQEVVSVGELKEGHYLLHIRTMTGGAINKVFKVVKRPEVDKNFSL